MVRRATEKTATRKRRAPAGQSPTRAGAPRKTRTRQTPPTEDFTWEYADLPLVDSPVAPAPRPRQNYHPGLLALIGGVFIFLLLGSTISARYGSPATAGAAARGTVPPSSAARTSPAPTAASRGPAAGLVNTPNPLDDTSSLAITGNVGGGKAFHGNIPYNSTTSFGSRLGSASLDPFLRYSALPEESGNSSAGYTPFYSPTGTVSKIQPGQSAVFAPGSPRVVAGPTPAQAEQSAGLMAPLEAPSPRLIGGRPDAGTAANAETWQWTGTSAQNQEQMRRLVAGDPDSDVTDRRPLTQSRQLMTSEEYQQQLEQLQRDLDRVRANASQLEQNLQTGRSLSAPRVLPRTMEPIQPLCSAETVQRIVQPDTQWQPPVANPPVGQDLLTTGGEVLPSVSRSQPSFEPTVPSGLAPSPSLTGAPELTLVPAHSPLNAAGTDTTAASRPGAYGQPTGWEPSVPTVPQPRFDSGLSTPTARPGQPRPESATPRVPTSSAPAGGTYGGPIVPGWNRDSRTTAPAAPRVPGGVPPSDTPATILQRSMRDYPAENPSSAPGGILGYQSPAGAGGRVSSQSPRATEVPKTAPRPVPAPQGGAADPRPVGLPSASRPIVPRESPPGAALTTAGGGTSLLPGRTAPIGTPPPAATIGRVPLTAAGSAVSAPGTVQPNPAGSPVPLPPARAASPSEPAGAVPESKFDRYMRLARLHIQSGQYSSAAEAYALAAVASPKDPRPQVGRCQALFAAGDYMGSTLCLANAIELNPSYVLKKPASRTDFIEAVGGPDRFIQRLKDLERQGGADKPPALQVLLAYIYQQVDQPDQARSAIRLAKRGLPSSPPVALLEAALDAKPPNQ